jgi:ubiquinone/menaquinone biosynthesis C-methylase UbiE
MYDLFSEDYDRFVNWEDRLAYEMPFIEEQINHLKQPGKSSLKILDSACGTGMHAIALAKQGHIVSAADLFPQMIKKGLDNAQREGVAVQFAAAGFGEMKQTFGRDQFELVLCLGNSLPHVLSETELFNALQDFASVLKQDGVLFIQNRNFDAVVKQQSRWMDKQVHQADGMEWIFHRYYDFLPNGLIRFNIATLKHEIDEDWKAGVTSTLLRPQLHDDLLNLLRQAGFMEIQAYGSMQAEPFAADSSGNLILTAKKA